MPEQQSRYCALGIGAILSISSSALYRRRNHIKTEHIPTAQITTIPIQRDQPNKVHICAAAMEKYSNKRLAIPSLAHHLDNSNSTRNVFRNGPIGNLEDSREICNSVELYICVGTLNFYHKCGYVVRLCLNHHVLRHPFHFDLFLALSSLSLRR